MKETGLFIQRQDKKEYSGKLFGISNSGELLLLDNAREKIFNVENSTIEDYGEQ